MKSALWAYAMLTSKLSRGKLRSMSASGISVPESVALQSVCMRAAARSPDSEIARPSLNHTGTCLPWTASSSATCASS